VWLLLALLVLVSTTLYALSNKKVFAAQLTNRSLTLQAGTVGGSAPSDGNPAHTVKHKFDFKIATTNSVGSIIFDYCTTANPSNPCTAPTDLDVSGATLDAQSGTGATGFAIDGTTDANTVVIDRTVSSISINTVVSYTLGSVINPSTANQTFYVRITTTDNQNGGGATVDQGTVAASTATAIQLTGYMPESLVFCTGGAVSLNGGGNPDCSTSTSGSLDFGDFSPTSTSSVISQMAASTNADFGYAITYTGATLTSGSNTITPMSAATTSSIGTSQFGLDLVTNDGTAYANAPNVTNSDDVNPVSGAATLQAKVTASYATAGTFKFTTSGDTVANSDFDGSSGPSDIQRYTVSYIVNVNGAQPVGTYTTTVTYICTATY
jgi:hypothetical protein